MIVVYCANRDIYPQLPTALNSLFRNNPEVEKIYLLIEDDRIPYINHPKVEFINCNAYDFLIREGLNCTKRFTYMAMTRCFLTKILKEDKILYLDVDTVVDADLQELWNYNMRGNYVAGREESPGYINSGVMLMNLRLIRSSGLDDRMIDLLKRCRFVFPDQDVINLVFKGSITFLPAKFNAVGADFLVYDKEISIRHFAGVTKPWKEKAAEKDKAFWNKYAVSEL